MHESTEALTVVVVGDIGPDRPDARELFNLNRSVLQEADLSIGQLELILSPLGERLPQVRHTARAKAEDAEALREAGLDVITFAGNHTLDFGTSAMLDTVRILEAQGLAVAGVGIDLPSAIEPVLIERRGRRIAVFSFASVMPQDYWATDRRAGCAPARAFTFYEQIEHDQPGTPSRVHTFPHREDLRQAVEAVRAARAATDVVLVAMHWGIHFIPAVIADYQRDYAHALIDAGADAILGHHPHILKGVEIYDGRPIFYSLGNFGMDTPITPEHVASKGFQEIQALNPTWVPNFEHRFNFPPDSRKTIFAKLTFSSAGELSVRAIPAWINDDSQAEILHAGDPRLNEVVDYLAAISREVDLETDYRIDGDEILIESGS
ncbi:CapA family protein [Microbacterium pumilum]|uniref:Capsule synthesis protein CapA domain-containing protein n=1 Tax=Microbacterium pumilum TaxID=344165 RepID=A0ABP5EHU9_9MICO